MTVQVVGAEVGLFTWNGGRASRIIFRHRNRGGHQTRACALVLKPFHPAIYEKAFVESTIIEGFQDPLMLAIWIIAGGYVLNSANKLLVTSKTTSLKCTSPISYFV